MAVSPKTFSPSGLVFPDYIIPKRLSYHFIHIKKVINIFFLSFKEKNAFNYDDVRQRHKIQKRMG